MFNDRDLGILGAGALLAVVCLFLPFSFVGKVVTGFLVLVGFMALALLRLGPDRVPSTSRLPRAGLKAGKLRDQQPSVQRSNITHPSLQPASFGRLTWPGMKSESIPCSRCCSE
jgi:hypothetical protein